MNLWVLSPLRGSMCVGHGWAQGLTPLATYLGPSGATMRCSTHLYQAWRYPVTAMIMSLISKGLENSWDPMQMVTGIIVKCLKAR